MNESTLPDIDLYGVLKLERSATTLEIQRAYKSLSRHFHPDKRRTAAEKETAEAIFVRIKQAHDVLSDRVLRFAYDHGGMIAVEMVKRSQTKAGGGDDPDEEDNKENNNTDEEDTENYYEEIRRAKSRAAALKIVRMLVHAYEEHQSSTQRTPLESTLTLQQCYHRYAPHPPYLASESTVMRLETSQTLTKQMDVAINCTSQVQRTASAALTTQVGLGYRPDGATQMHLFGAAGTGGSSLTLQTTRRLYDKSLVTVGAGGSLAGGSSGWNGTLASSRVLLLGSLLGGNNHGSKRHQQQSRREPTKVNASWRLGVNMVTGELQSLMAQTRTLHFPQWRIRLGLGGGGPLLKLTYNHASEHSFHCTYAWHWLWWRAKLTKEDAIDDNWTIRYGVKYDVRGAVVGQPWSLVVHLHSDEWTLRIPVDLVYRSEWPATALLSFLAARWVEDWLETYTTTVGGSGGAPSQPTAHHSFRDVMERVAHTKRAAEERSDGLVFLKAVWKEFAATSSSKDEDVTDLLQFWTCQGQLHLATYRARWSAAWVPHATEETAGSWWWRWLQRLVRRWRGGDDVAPLEDSIYVRYQYRGKVYEVELPGDETELVFPHPRATLMGDAGVVV